MRTLQQKREQAKRFYNTHRAVLNNKSKARYLKLRDERYTCPQCGANIRVVSRAAHLRTKKHAKSPTAPTPSPAPEAETDTSAEILTLS